MRSSFVDKHKHSIAVAAVETGFHETLKMASSSVVGLTDGGCGDGDAWEVAGGSKQRPSAVTSFVSQQYTVPPSAALILPGTQPGVDCPARCPRTTLTKLGSLSRRSSRRSFLSSVLSLLPPPLIQPVSVLYRWWTTRRHR